MTDLAREYVTQDEVDEAKAWLLRESRTGFRRMNALHVSAYIEELERMLNEVTTKLCDLRLGEKA